MTYYDRSYYVGNFKNDQRSGKGLEVYPDQSKYEGEYLNDLRDGFGSMTWVNGRVYTGEFRNDIVEGQGTCVYPNGEKYVGKGFKTHLICRSVERHHGEREGSVHMAGRTCLRRTIVRIRNIL